MKFDKHDYPAIRHACESKQEIEFEALKEDTGFATSSLPPPSDWTAYPPMFLPPEGYAQVFIRAGNDARSELMQLELLVHLDGGRILYKGNGPDSVLLRVTWPITK